MNKYQEALKKLCDGCEYGSFIGKCSFSCPAKEELKELVEKATPKKTEVYAPLGLDLCPTCGKDTVSEWYKYCPHCGQRLLWGEEDEQN